MKARSGRLSTKLEPGLSDKKVRAQLVKAVANRGPVVPRITLYWILLRGAESAVVGWERVCLACLRVDARCRAGDGSVLRVRGIVSRLSAVHHVARETDDFGENTYSDNR